MSKKASNIDDSPLRVLAVTQGQWGERIAENIRVRAPADWSVEVWAAPSVIPPVVDDPQDFLPPTLPEVDLVLALGDTTGLAQLVPDIARVTGAKAVIAPIDRNTSLPAGLARQLAGWLKEMDVAAAFPKPFCSLTETTYNRTPLVTSYDDPTIQRFARYFGKPEFRVTLDAGQITEVEVLRDAACGCARYVADNLVGISADEALEKAGILHHHYPCLASMERDPDYFDTLMHVSGNLLKDSLRETIKDHITITFVRPSGYVEET
ncbi:MAG: hypothetical protein AMJ88_05960 [Anaerolineae bacterium SM23_ 63]|nr:MAG: hypothetical protein AMJ88_05960 [Anaerolineae bacterium SM23_ 63]